jgi:hypothetical protein
MIRSPILVSQQVMPGERLKELSLPILKLHIIKNHLIGIEPLKIRPTLNNFPLNKILLIFP